MERIEIIDDDEEFASNLSIILKNEGYSTNIRNDTEGAVEQLVREKPDLLILDVMFPENPAAGFDLARKIRGTHGIEKLPILLLTSVNQEFPMDFSAGDIDPDWMPVHDFVEKPVNTQELLKKIKKLLSHSSA